MSVVAIVLTIVVILIAQWLAMRDGDGRRDPVAKKSAQRAVRRALRQENALQRAGTRTHDRLDGSLVVDR
jgi:hypothetical protein